MDATPDTIRHSKHVSDTYLKAGGNQHADLKIILVLRDPAARELSLYNHMVVEYLKTKSRDEWFSVVAKEDGLAMSFDEYVTNVLEPDLTS